jgi:YEATS domain-containing protein 4
VRGQHFEDLSPLLKKVVFLLHESFEKRVREATSAPFEVKESGWGAFDILIQVHLKAGPVL